MPSLLLPAALLVWVVFSTSTMAQLQAPLCSQRCLLPVLSTLTCYSNTSSSQELANCFCPDVAAQAIVATCVQESCNYTEQYISSKVGLAWCEGQPIESRSQVLIITIAFLLCFVTIFVSLRVWSRLITGYKIGWDDYTLGVATVAVYGFLAIGVPNATQGTGKHIWDQDPDDGPALRKIFYAETLLYIAAQVFTKLSLILFYLRIFPYQWVRIASWIMFVWLIGHGIIFFFLEIFECWPVAAFWDYTIAGSCRNETIIYYLGAAASLVEDLYIMALPVPCISSLSLGIGKKTLICFVFALGSLASIASIVRIKVLNSYINSSDLTWFGLDLDIWSCVEVSMAVICSCLPTLRPVLLRCFPRVFGNPEQSSQLSPKYVRSFPFGLRHIPEDVEAAPKISSSQRKESKKSSAAIIKMSSDSTLYTHDELEGQDDKLPMEKDREDELELIASPYLNEANATAVVKTAELRVIESTTRDQNPDGGIQVLSGAPNMQKERDPYNWELSYLKQGAKR